MWFTKASSVAPLWFTKASGVSPLWFTRAPTIAPSWFTRAPTIAPSWFTRAPNPALAPVHSEAGQSQDYQAVKLSREITSKITPEEKSQMESDGGIDKNELDTVLFKINIKPSAEITKIFNKLDKNKNGKLEESELSSPTKGGEDYFFGGLFASLAPVLIQNLPSILQVGGQVLQGVLSQQGSAQPGDYSQLHSDQKQNDGGIDINEITRKYQAVKLSREITSKITPEEKSQMESDGGIDTNEWKTILSNSNIKPSAEITKIFNELDTNKNGILEESELSSAIEGGEDYILGSWFFNGLFTPGTPPGWPPGCKPGPLPCSPESLHAASLLLE